MIEFVDIHKAFGPKVVLAGANLQVDTGEIMFIIGQSGAGKSVLVKHLVGLLRPDKGRVILDGEDITDLPTHQRAQRGLKRSFQVTSIFTMLTVHENARLAAQAELGGSFEDLVGACNFAHLLPPFESVT